MDADAWLQFQELFLGLKSTAVKEKVNQQLGKAGGKAKGGRSKRQAGKKGAQEAAQEKRFTTPKAKSIQR
eukprot:7397123-Lingulodinium_polyedra.AAC.1